MLELNLLTEAFLTTSAGGAGKIRRTLPGVFAALTRGEIDDFPRVRPHQRHVWHAFLVQAATLALSGSSRSALPDDEETWRNLLTGMSPDDPHGVAWSLVSPPNRPAFFQPPILGVDLSGYKRVFETPDELDMLVMAKNHDLKAGALPSDDPELWVYALVSLQTQEGFLGQGNYGISRMNGGFASRPALGVGPDGGASERFQRDAKRLLSLRAELSARYGYPSKGGLGLLWLNPWDGTTSMSPKDLDVFYIEVCRRVRLDRQNGQLLARAAGSKVARIEAKAMKGVTGDAWTPLVIEKNDAKALTLDARGWTYQQLVRLLFPHLDEKGAGVESSPLQSIAPTDPEKGLSFIARVLVRGQGKTEGFHERRIPVSKELRGFLGTAKAMEEAAKVAHDRVGDAGKFARKVLYPAIMTVFTGAPRTDAGERARDDQSAKDRANAALKRYDAWLDLRFFEDLDKELAVLDEEGEAVRVRAYWIRDVLKPLGKDVLDDTIAAAPDAAARHWRVRVRAQEVLNACFRRAFNDQVEAALGKEPNNALEDEST